MRLWDLCRAILLIYILSGISAAISVSVSSSGGGEASSISENYILDSSAHLAESTTLGRGSISSSSSVDGSGNNSITKTASNQGSTVTSSITSTESISAALSSYASGSSLRLDQNVYVTGLSEGSISGLSGSLQADQISGVLNGALASSQTVMARDGSVSAEQAFSISGPLAYSSGQSQSANDQVMVTGGLNGIGMMQGGLAAVASDKARASGSIEADSLDSKAYSAVKSSSTQDDVYSYLSSRDHLSSSLSGSADGHVTVDQNLLAEGDVQVYASSTSEDSSSKSYDSRGDAVSGSLSASAGSPALIETNLVGDVASSAAGLIPTPGSWVWNGLGGYITSNPYQLQSDGKTHIFAKGGNNGLWDNFDGDWQSLGGVITSDPIAAKDGQGKVHVLVRGSSGALFDRIVGEGWANLGGYITSNPGVALSPDDHLKAVVRGGDNSLWQKDLTTGVWSPMGGIIASNPQAIFDQDGKMHVLVRGADNGLWDNVNGVWQFRGGYITSDAKAVLDPFHPETIYTSVRGGDGSLWYNALDTTSGAATWTGLGGFIKGTPAPVMDTDGVLHNFVRGGNDGLWDNANGGWYSLGGIITSDPNAMRSNEGKLQVAAVGGDSGLWVNTVGIGLDPTTLVGPIACDYKKIQDAVDNMDNGSIIKVLSGKYLENVVLDKSLTLKGAGADKTIVDGNQTGSVFTIGKDNPNVDVDLSGMTIQGGTGTQIERFYPGNVLKCGGGILNYGTMKLEDSTISGNTAYEGGGIYNNGTMNLKGGSITENTAFFGGGIYSSAGTVTMNGGSITKNNAEEGDGGDCDSSSDKPS